jgi:hypothetical protein
MAVEITRKAGRKKRSGEEIRLKIRGHGGKLPCPWTKV